MHSISDLLRKVHFILLVANYTFTLPTSWTTAILPGIEELLVWSFQDLVFRLTHLVLLAINVVADVLSPGIFLQENFQT